MADGDGGGRHDDADHALQRAGLPADALWQKEIITQNLTECYNITQ